MRTHFGRIGTGFRAEISENDEILDLAGVLEYNTRARGPLCAKDLVIGHLNKADQLRAIQIRYGVMLRWKIIAFGFPFLADKLGMLLRLMHVVWNRTHAGVKRSLRSGDGRMSYQRSVVIPM
jgi:hypothetical protein